MENVNIISSRARILAFIHCLWNYAIWQLCIFYKYRMGMGAVHAAGTAAGWGQGLPGGPQLPPHHATTVTAPPGVQAAPPPPPPPAQMMAYPMQQFQVTITLSIPSVHACKCAPYLSVWCLLANTRVFRFLRTFASCPCYVQKQFRQCRYWLVNVARGNSIRHQKKIGSMCWQKSIFVHIYYRWS